MVDASVGIKVAVNYKRKNGVGHFFSPSHTFVDTSFLPTVSYPDVISGCGEIMKAALVHDGTLFDLMEAHGARLIDKKFVDDPVADDVIKRSVDTMLECIGPDLWEESLLRPMDFGHSFSRTLETTEAFKLRHGEAVAIDCIMNTMIANDKGLLSDADTDRCAYTDEMTDDEIERAFAKLSKFIDAHPETKWDPSKSFAADRES
ncbi:shikimate 3-dehydrogenase [Aureococcus anophagefferens]|nr:shikimate 3-dehydrogenase [Aureococcus anophagefferens]